MISRVCTKKQGQSTLEVGMALSLCILIIMATVWAWAWFNNRMKERYVAYESTRRMSVRDINNPGFGLPLVPDLPLSGPLDLTP